MRMSDWSSDVCSSDLLVSALIVGVAEMGEMRALKTVGLRTLVYTVVVSSIAVAVSLAVVNALQPGAGVDPALAKTLLAEGAARAGSIIQSEHESKSGVDDRKSTRLNYQ